MKIICAPDSFKESISSVDAADAMCRGIRQLNADIDVDRCPIGDGGEGTLEVLAGLPGTKSSKVDVKGPFGENVTATFCVVGQGEYAFIEAAQCIGLGLVPAEKRDPTRTSSFGVGELILCAAKHARNIVVGIGGSSTNDGGCGMAQALGFRFLDSQGHLLPELFHGGMLQKVARIDGSERTPVLRRIRLSVASDVRNPLTGRNGASIVYGPQKGARPNQVTELENGLVHLASIIRRDLGADIQHLDGSGAAGGLGGGLVAFADGAIQSGIDFVLDAVDFSRRVQGCDLCITGEGRIDGQSLAGKACIGVARAAASRGVRTVALVGSVGRDAHRCLNASLHRIRNLSDGLTRRQSMARVAELIAAAAADEVQRVAAEKGATTSE